MSLRPKQANEEVQRSGYLRAVDDHNIWSNVMQDQMFRLTRDIEILANQQKVGSEEKEDLLKGIRALQGKGAEDWRRLTEKTILCAGDPADLQPPDRPESEWIRAQVRWLSEMSDGQVRSMETRVDALLASRKK